MGFLKDRIWIWGYVLDHTPGPAPFFWGNTRCSLETGAEYLGANKAFYMNTMFNEEYFRKTFDWDWSIYENGLGNRLSDLHMQKMKNFSSIYCTLEHLNYLNSAVRIARKSLEYKNIKGILFDDFRPDQGGGAIEEVYNYVKEINPDLQIVAVTYTHQPKEYFLPAVKYFDVFTRWQWTPSDSYWDQHRDDIQILRDTVGPDKTIMQGIYIHDFGGDCPAAGEDFHYVPLNTFKKSIETICQHVCDGGLDGIIIPQPAWFCVPSHKEHITWMKEYIDWCDSTMTGSN